MARRLAILAVLALTAVILVLPSAAAGGGCHANPAIEMTSSSNNNVGIGECAFINTVTYIEPGEKVTWINKDPVPHTVSGAAYSWGSERLLDQSDRVSYTFKKEGVYPYYCALHPSMVGAVVVGDATNAAVLSNGMADVDENKPGSAAAAEETEPATGSETSSSAAIGLAIVLTLGVVFVASRFALRRRAASATPAP